MKTTAHVADLLRQGRKPQELLDVGFPNGVSTEAQKQLNREKGVNQAKVFLNMIWKFYDITDILRQRSESTSFERHSTKLYRH